MRISALFILAALLLSGPAGSAWAAPSSSDLAASALAVAKEVHPSVDVQAYLKALDGLGQRLAGQLRGTKSATETLERMGRFLYQQEGYAKRELIPANVFVGLDEVIDKRQWNCLGLSLLYVVLGERVGLPLQLVSGPAHALVRYQEGAETLYVETTDGGRVHPSLEYLDAYLPFPCAEPLRFKALNASEALATILSQSAAAVFQGGEAPRALAFFKRALELDPKHAEAWVGIGTVHVGAGNAAGAVEAFRKAVALDANLVEAWGGLGNALYQSGDVKGAIDAYRRLLVSCKENPKGNYNLAHLLYESGDLDGSIAIYRTYVVLQPDDPAGYTGLAFPLEDKGDFDAAIKAYARALELDPRQADAWVNLGLVLAKKREFSKAVEAHERALKLQPDYALARQGRGEALLAMGKTAEALEDFTIATRLAPDDVSIAVDLAAALTASGKAKEALEVLRPVQAREAENPDVYEALADAHEKAGDAAAAQKARETQRRLSATK